MARLDAPTKVAGETVYAADVRLPGLCHAALVRSPFPHAQITALNAAEALEVPGVLGVFGGADLPPRTHGRRVRDVPLLARGEARFAGEPVAVVVAESRAAAERGAARVHVAYEALPAVLDAEEAVRPGAPAVHAAPWTYPGAGIREADGHNLQSSTHHASGGDVDAALRHAAFRLDQVYTSPFVHQGYIEPQACVGWVDPADGRRHVWMANKSPYALRGQLAACLELPPERIEVHPVAVGGDFGGKGSPMYAPLCLEVSARLGRPVKLVLRYAEDLMAANPRHASRIRVQLGCDREGHLAAMAVDALFNGGAYGGFKPLPDISLHGAGEVGTAYRIPAVRVDCRIAYTHTVPGGHMRAPGAPQVTFALESALDELAAAAGLDPVDLRRKNLLRNGDANHHGVRWAEARAGETLDAAMAAVRRRPVPAGWRHGLGVAVYDRGTILSRTALRIRGEADGSVTAFVAFPENGAGGHTVVQRALARALDMPPERVAVRQVSTDGLPHDDGVGGSWTTTGAGLAAQRAAEAWRAQGGRGEVMVTSEPGGEEPVTAFSVQVAQVAVDPETGRMQVLEVLSAVDVAEVVNPLAHRIQIEGGAAMGYGYACLEDLEVSEGRVGAANLGEFKLPSARDVPDLPVVLVTGARGVGALNLKPVGELANVPTAGAIANALAAAGVRLRSLPLTAEKVFFALHPEGARDGSGAPGAPRG
jgi:CO/xanthine dehydrogenase Mo-binding subunit